MAKVKRVRRKGCGPTWKLPWPLKIWVVCHKCDSSWNLKRYMFLSLTWFSYTCPLGYERKPSISNPRNSQDLGSKHNGKKNKGFLWPCLGSTRCSKWLSEVAVGRQNVLTQDLGSQPNSSIPAESQPFSLYFSKILIAALIICFPLRLYSQLYAQERNNFQYCHVGAGNSIYTILLSSLHSLKRLSLNKTGYFEIKVFFIFKLHTKDKRAEVCLGNIQ